MSEWGMVSGPTKEEFYAAIASLSDEQRCTALLFASKMGCVATLIKEERDDLRAQLEQERQRTAEAREVIAELLDCDSRRKGTAKWDDQAERARNWLED